ncbi:uncharacterized protein LOC134855288 [Symsagittifera roscoffensis]|uniref:uncharacterized protein LOC134855288 n=1 Tax=Symsagittifera roscoffensis TaxID=84072 RepID=UPI00307BE4C5
MILTGKDVKEYSDPMRMEWDKEQLRANGKAPVHFEFLPPDRLVTAKTDIKMELKLTYQATSASVYYRQQDIRICMYYYPLLCLKDVKLTPHEDISHFSIRLLLLNGSPHTVHVDGNGGHNFQVRPYSVSRNLLKCRRSNDFPKSDDNKEWLVFVRSKLNLVWTYQHRRGIVNPDPLFQARVEWWRKAVRIPKVIFDLQVKDNKSGEFKAFLPISNLKT